MLQDYNTMFWLLVFTAVVAVIGIMSAANSLRTIVKSDFFLEHLRKVQESKTLKTIALLVLTSIPGAMMAQETVVSEPLFEIGESEVLAMAIVNIVLIGVLLFLRKTIKEMLQMVVPEKIVEQKKESVSKLNKILNDSVAIEEEYTILMDHEYDGIQELDNNLPPWWKWGFYLTIFVAIIYLGNYHVLKLGDLQIAEYNHEVEVAEAEVMAYLESMALNVDENSVVTLTDPSALDAGKAIFIKNCAVCHKEDGGGQVGPNLTDDYWLYGPDIKNIFKTVKYGANNGMTAWKEKLTPVEIQNVSSFIRSLHGTTPQEAKEPQGSLMEFMPDDSAIQMDSLAVE